MISKISFATCFINNVSFRNYNKLKGLPKITRDMGVNLNLKKFQGQRIFLTQKQSGSPLSFIFLQHEV